MHKAKCIKPHPEQGQYQTGHLPAINGKRFPAAFTPAPVPATESIVGKIWKFRDPLAGFPIIQQQDRIRPSRNPVTLALTANTGLKLQALC